MIDASALENLVTLDGGAGNDSAVGGSGDDSLFRDRDNNTLSGEVGSDMLDGSVGKRRAPSGGNADARQLSDNSI